MITHLFGKGGEETDSSGFLFFKVLEKYMEDAIQKWIDSGKGIPAPQEYKIKTIKEYAKEFDTSTFVETGTHTGSTLFSVKDHFDRLYSIELGQKLYNAAVIKFKGIEKISLIYGDSGVELKKLVALLACKSLFWLDAHWSWGNTAKGNTDSALHSELPAVLSLPEEMGNVILIDDTYSMHDGDGYLSVDTIIDRISKSYPTYKIEIDGYIIRAFPGK